MCPRGLDLCALLLAAFGAVLAIEACLADSRLRYALAGLGFGAALAAPLLSIWLLREPARRFWRRMLVALVPVTALFFAAEIGIRRFGPTAARNELFSAIATTGLKLVDLAPLYVASLAAGRPIWGGNGDGHLLKNGHLAAANAIEVAWARK